MATERRTSVSQDRGNPSVSNAQSILDRFSSSQSASAYRHEHWQGSFAEYLDIVSANPKVTRSAYQRLYDMILADGSYPVEGSKDQTRFRFFDDPHHGGAAVGAIRRAQGVHGRSIWYAQLWLEYATGRATNPPRSHTSRHARYSWSAKLG